MKRSTAIWLGLGCVLAVACALGIWAQPTTAVRERPQDGEPPPETTAAAPSADVRPVDDVVRPKGRPAGIDTDSPTYRGALRPRKWTADMGHDRAELEPAVRAVFDALLPIACDVAATDDRFRYLLFRRITLGPVGMSPEPSPASTILGQPVVAFMFHEGRLMDEPRARFKTRIEAVFEPMRHYTTTPLPPLEERRRKKLGELRLHRAQCGPPWGPAYGELPPNPSEVE